MLFVSGSPWRVRPPKPKRELRLNRATAVFREIMRTPDKAIPGDLLDKAECVAIVPGLKKGGLGIGGRYGKGVVMCRRPDRKWSAPSFLTIEGGSIGFQIGFTQIDVVMLMMNRKGRNCRDSLPAAPTIGCCGPGGRQASPNHIRAGIRYSLLARQGIFGVGKSWRGRE